MNNYNCGNCIWYHPGLTDGLGVCRLYNAPMGAGCSLCRNYEMAPEFSKIRDDEIYNRYRHRV